MSDDTLIGINPNIGSQYIDESTDISDISETDLDFSDETTEQKDSLVIDDSYEGSLVAERQLKEAQTKGPEQRTVDTSLDIYPQESPIDELLDKFGMSDSKDETLVMMTDDYKSEQDQEIKKELLQEAEKYLQLLKDEQEKLQAKSETAEELMATSVELQSEQTKGTDQAKELSKSTKLAQESNKTEETQELSNKALDESIKFHKKASKRLAVIEAKLQDPATPVREKLALLQEMSQISKDFKEQKEKLGDNFEKVKASLNENELAILENAESSFAERIETVEEHLNNYTNNMAEKLQDLINDPTVSEENKAKYQEALEKIKAMQEKLQQMQGMSPDEIADFLGQEGNESLMVAFMSVVDNVNFDEQGNGFVENPQQGNQELNPIFFDDETFNSFIQDVHRLDKDFLQNTFGTNSFEELQNNFDKFNTESAIYARDKLSQELDLTKSRVEDERDLNNPRTDDTKKTVDPVKKLVQRLGIPEELAKIFLKTGNTKPDISIIMNLLQIDPFAIASGQVAGLGSYQLEAKQLILQMFQMASYDNVILQNKDGSSLTGNDLRNLMINTVEDLINKDMKDIEPDSNTKDQKKNDLATTQAWLEASNTRDLGIRSNEISNRYGTNGYSSFG